MKFLGEALIYGISKPQSVLKVRAGWGRGSGRGKNAVTQFRHRHKNNSCQTSARSCDRSLFNSSRKSVCMTCQNI